MESYAIRRALQNMVADKLKDFNTGGLPFNILIDLNYYKSMRFLITPAMGNHFNSLIVVNGETREYHSSIPTEIEQDNIEVVKMEEIDVAGIFVPEFRTVMLFTKEFEKKLANNLLDMNSTNVDVGAREWIMAILRLNLYTMQNKMSCFNRYYVNQGKAKGLSRKEIEYIKESLIPVYVKADIEGLMSIPTPLGSYIQRNLKKASTLVDRLVVGELGKEVRVDNKVYFGGYNCYRDDSRAITCYAPKIVLLDKGANTIKDFYINLIAKINATSDEELNEMFSEDKVVMGLEVEASGESEE